jgi:hypothetical protein
MAMAIGAVQGDHMGLFDVLVMPHARRRGLARRSPRASMPGRGRTARASPICRSSPPTRQRCRSTPRRVSARLRLRVSCRSP